MKSRISLDIDRLGQPEIKIEHSRSEDMRDKTLSILMDNVNWADGYNKINTYPEIPKGVFVVKERYERLHSQRLGGETSPSDGKPDRIDNYTLVPLNRIDFQTTFKQLNPDLKRNEVSTEHWTIQNQIDSIRDLYIMLGLKPEPVDRLERILNAIPDLHHKLNEFSLIQYQDSDNNVLSNIKGYNVLTNDSNYVLSKNGKVSRKIYEETFKQGHNHFSESAKVGSWEKSEKSCSE